MEQIRLNELQFQITETQENTRIEKQYENIIKIVT